MSRWLLYLGQWVVFAIHGLLALAYRVALFLSSRGSLLIVPVLVALAVFQFHEFFRDGVRDLLLEFRPGDVPAPLALDVLLAALLALAILLYRLVAHRLAIKRFLLVPVLAGLALVLFRAPLHDELKLLLLPYPLEQMPDPVTLDVVLVVLLLLALVLYQPFSHMLWVVLGTFPQLSWPLRPFLRLRPEARPIAPVPVRLAVPKLPRRRWKLRWVQRT
jgi:hypothetical protein